ncbi:MAG: efflux RND transporter periplasmic adaptor subunit [Alphaproteobacteria bacterium]
MKKILAVLVIAGLGYGGYVMFGKSHPPAGADFAAMGPMPVSVAKAIGRDVQSFHEFSGRLTAMEQVQLRPRVAGTIEKVHIRDGQIVKKGDVLFTIDPRPFEAALKAAQARAVFASAELERAGKLLADKAIAAREYDEKKNMAAVAKADLTKAELDLEYTSVKSPINGQVSRAEITEGNMINGGGDAPILTTIISLDSVYADVDMDEKTYVDYIQSAGGNAQKLKGMAVDLQLIGEKDFPHHGKIVAFDNQLNVASGTIRVRAAFDNKQGLLVPGLYAKLRMGSLQPQQAVLINEGAIGTDQAKKYVFVVGDDGTANYREIQQGSLAEGLRVITSGLQAGEKIVVNGLQRVRPGAKIVPQEVPMPGAANVDGKPL